MICPCCNKSEMLFRFFHLSCENCRAKFWNSDDNATTNYMAGFNIFINNINVIYYDMSKMLIIRNGQKSKTIQNVSFETHSDAMYKNINKVKAILIFS